MVSTSSTTVIGFSLAGSSIPAGESTLLTLTYDALTSEACIDAGVVSGVVPGVVLSVVPGGSTRRSTGSSTGSSAGSSTG